MLCHLIIQPTKDTLFERLKFFFTKFVASTLEMGNPLQTLYGIADSSVGLADLILDHDWPSLELIKYL